MIKYIHIVLAIWILAVVPMGFAESFPNRPTAYDLDELVVLGKECVRGVNERCWATQYSTNPVTYYVAPFTNTAGFYLDQSLIGTMASKIKSLVPYYADPDTVYNGTTNIVMLSVAGIWVALDIGDHTNQFTQTFASGTNAAVYGDSPWRICQENLDERYDVLNALNVVKMLNDEDLWTKDIWAWSVGGFSTWADCRTAMETAFATQVFDKSWSIPGTYPGSLEAADTAYALSIGRVTGTIWGVTSVLLADLTGNVQLFIKPTLYPSGYSFLAGNGVPLTTTNYNLVHEMTVMGGENATYSLPDESGLPNPTPDPMSDPGHFSYRGFEYNSADCRLLCTWDFQYCTDEY